MLTSVLCLIVPGNVENWQDWLGRERIGEMERVTAGLLEEEERGRGGESKACAADHQVLILNLSVDTD